MSTLHFQKPEYTPAADLALFRESFRTLVKREDLGFFRWPSFGDEYAKVIDQATRLRNRTTRLVVIGLGGSQMAGQCLINTIAGPNHNVEFWGEIDPLFLEEKLASPLLDDTTFLIISKSGNTLEVATLMNVVNEPLLSRGISLASRAFVITENRQENPLRQWALASDVPILDHPRDVGGRYSVFTPVGIFPAIFAGVDVEKLRAGAQWMLTQEQLVSEVSQYFHTLFNRKKTITVFWSYIHRLAAFQNWLEQLWAESLGQSHDRAGKTTSGVSTPLMVEGVSAQHSVLQQFSDGADDKGFLFFRLDPSSYAVSEMRDSLIPGFEFLKGKSSSDVFNAESNSVEEALTLKGRMCASIHMNRVDAYTVGALLMMFQLIVGTLGEALNLNVYVQPGVEQGKILALQKLRS